MDEGQHEEKLLPYVSMTTRQVVQVVIWGCIAGIVAWGLSYVLEMYVLKAVLCQGEASARCSLSSQYAHIMASILAAGVGLFALVKLQIFRPLLVVLAALISFWSLGATLGLLVWYQAALAYALLYGVAYMAFAWVARIRLFWTAILLVVVLVSVVRFILNS